jgi:hypothetical protein
LLLRLLAIGFTWMAPSVPQLKPLLSSMLNTKKPNMFSQKTADTQKSELVEARSVEARSDLKSDLESESLNEAAVEATTLSTSDIRVVLEEWASNVSSNNPNVFLSALPESVESSGRQSPVNDSESFPTVEPMD